MAATRKERPFPWTCSQCLKEAVVRESVSYTTTVKHDGTSYTINVLALIVPKCQECGNLMLDRDAEDQIHAALRAQLGLLTPDQIRECRLKLRMNQQQFAEGLIVAKETVSRWETGALIQSKHNDKWMRLFFRSPEARTIISSDDGNDLLCVESSDSDASVEELSQFELALEFYGQSYICEEAERIRNGAMIPVC